jgi:nicotinamidase-related amidase
MDSVLIVIDIQESFRQRPIWREVSNPDLVPRVNRLVEAARAGGDLVVWVRHAEPGSGGLFDPESGFVRYVEGLAAPLPGEPELVKTSHNAFTTTNLAQLLTERGIRHLIVTGIRTEQCCETTARLGCDLGYDVSFVTEATATFPSPHWTVPDGMPLDEILADPRTLSGAEMTARTEYALAGRFATIRGVDELVAGAGSRGVLTGS